MAKVLVVRKPDATVHVVALENEGILKAHSSKLPTAQQWKFELMDEEAAAKLPFVDPDYIKPNEAQDQAKLLLLENMRLKEQLAAGTGGAATDPEKEAMAKELEELKAKLAAQNTAPEKAAVLIEKIGKALTEAEVNELLGSDTRPTVVKAATDRIEELKMLS